ncbi:hypothetical protein RHMOL_Rhmol12G0233600 [Rhododendron molle]|uniref:Uncharacterized protein n=1 Tax=Rhododendron molle TaxID=49168 RepID=A0ACC0LMD1_RHOML|nr:hypothetical protein RHMOL_Rhmol12G0233600 [Rhododendron molle]
MSTEEEHAVTVRDLAEEAKKRIVFLIMCAVGLSYLLSLTSSSVCVNLPAAASLIVTVRYFSRYFEMRGKAAVYNSKPTLAHISSKTKPFEGPNTGVMKSDWRRKVNSPVVEDALDQFTRHLVSEWVMDLWYSRLTPDRQGPEELVHIMHGVLGEISSRLRNVNLIDLLTRDVISILCTHLELFRSSQSKIEKHPLGPLTFERRDVELKSILFADNKLHPALFSAEAEHKVLRHLMDGLISFTFKPEDLQCSLFRFTVRELLACALMRPVLNLANPRFLNERVESVAISLRKANKGAATLLASQSKSKASSRISSDHFSRILDPSVKGVELVPLKKDPPKTLEEKSTKDNANGTLTKDPLLCMDTRSTLSWSSQPLDPLTGDDRGSQRHHSGEIWDGTVDMISCRETKALAPNHFENYRRKEDENYAIESEIKSSSATYKTADNLKLLSREKEKDGATKISSDHSNAALSRRNGSITSHLSAISYLEFDENDLMRLEEVESGSSSYTGEDDETSSVTGLDSPVTKVWDGKLNRYLLVSHIHHPLESSEGCNTTKGGVGHLHSRLHRTQSRRKRFKRLSSQKRHIWQEVERTSFYSGDGQDILNSFKGRVESEDSSDDYEAEVLGRIHSGATASSSTSSTSLLNCDNLAVNAQKNSLFVDSFLKLRCESQVLGANIVKGGSRTFAVYSISVTDTNENSWSIKRRFRHFEELHRRLKEFPEYNLHLPPKHFLSTGLDVLVIRERCKLLHKYLKKLLQLPTISESIEIWDFLSVDSQTYVFSHSISIIEILSVGLDSTTHERSEEAQNAVGQTVNPLPSHCEHRNAESKESALAMKHNIVGDGSRVQAQGAVYTQQQKPSEDSDKSDQRNISLSRKCINRIEGDDLQASSQPIIGAASYPTLPTEWVQPNLSAPLLELVDVVFQLQDGGWIRRKAFWVAKQILQLGMGDAFDDWLIEKIQLLRRGSVVASGIKRIEQVLWPDGIFITKHPKRRQPNPSGSTPQSSPRGHPPTSVASPKKVDAVDLDENRLKEAERRARFVHELMIDNAPPAIVGLVGHKGYEQCARDVYYFLQSSVCLKQLAFDLLELLLLSAFPEMDYVFQQLHEEKEKFGEFRPT